MLIFYMLCLPWNCSIPNAHCILGHLKEYLHIFSVQISLVLNVLLENQWPAIHRGASQAEEQLRRLAEKEGGTGTNPQNPFVQIQKLIVQVFWWYFFISKCFVVENVVRACYCSSCSSSTTASRSNLKYHWNMNYKMKLVVTYSASTNPLML